MAISFTEDLDAFFDTPGFTVPVVQGSTTSVGYFESPNEIIADGVVLTTDYAVVVKTSDFSSVSRGDTMTVDSVAYTVREQMLLDDGKIMRVMLMKDRFDDNKARKHPCCHQNGSNRYDGGRYKDL